MTLPTMERLAGRLWFEHSQVLYKKNDGYIEEYTICIGMKTDNQILVILKSKNE